MKGSLFALSYPLSPFSKRTQDNSQNREKAAHFSMQVTVTAERERIVRITHASSRLPGPTKKYSRYTPMTIWRMLSLKTLFNSHVSGRVSESPRNDPINCKLTPLSIEKHCGYRVFLTATVYFITMSISDKNFRRKRTYRSRRLTLSQETQWLARGRCGQS